MPINVTRVLLFFLLVSAGISAQSELTPPDNEFLNEFIAGDTTATGERAAADRVYVLERGKTYYVRGQFRTQIYPLHIRSAEGDGPRAIIRPSADQEGAINAQMIRVYDDAIFEDVHLDGTPFQEGQVRPFRLIRTEGEGSNLTVRNCILTNAAQALVRVNRAAGTVLFEDNIVGNMGDISRDNLGNGRVVDARGSSIENLLIEDNTFVNIMDRVVRHRGGSGVIQRMEMNHNTIINHMGYHGFIELGNFGDSAIITNNLVVDGMTMGSDLPDLERNGEFDSHTERIDTFNKPVWIGSVPNDSSFFIINENIYSVSDAVQGFYDARDIDEGALLTDHIAGKLPDGNVAFEKAAVEVTTSPAPPIDLMNWYWTPLEDGG
ncbi:MAG: hypothetical protein AAFN92_11780, partial [Bacteroidota bacterium]